MSMTIHQHILFYRRNGEIIQPQPDSVVIPRSGVFAVAIGEQDGEKAVLMCWPPIAKGWADLPGGGIDPGETIDEAMRREWDEETGLPFTPMQGPLVAHHHQRGYYAEDKNQFWIYDQTFHLYRWQEPVVIGQRWINPENDPIAWEKLADLDKLPINRGHWLGIEAVLRKAYG